MTSKHPANRTFLSGDLKLHYLEWGNPESVPMVLIHHLNSHAHTWDRFAASMSNDYRVLALDLRGHGDSQWATAGNYKTVDFASDVAALIDHLDLERAIILGGSVGGRVALVYAGQHPERTTALIMEDVGPVRTADSAANLARRAEVDDPEFDGIDDVVAYIRAHPDGHSAHRPEEAWRHMARHATKLKANGKLMLKRDNAMYGSFETLELWDYAERVGSPFLLILGADSSTVSPKHRDRMIQTFADSTLVTVQWAGHQVVHDRPQEYEWAVREFLTKHNL